LIVATLFEFSILACDGCFKGFPAWLMLIISVICLIGSIWMLLWSNYGARMAYLITMVSLSAFMIIFAALWLVGAPGTTTATGPRGREVQWIPFLPDSEFAESFQDSIDAFPDGDGWQQTGTIFPGNVDTAGEFETVRTIVANALADLSAVQGTDAVELADWRFRDKSREPTTPDEEDPALYTPATVAFNQAASTKLIMGVTIPATDNHPRVTVFAYRDKGLVFLPTLIILLVSIFAFVLHVWLIGRAEAEEKEREAAMGQPVPLPEPATT
jgi:hypothetical protein